MSEFTATDTLALAESILHNEVPKEYTSTDAQSALRHSIIELNNGSEKLNPRTFRPGTELFAFIEDLINIVENEGLKGDEFFMQFVDYRNVAEGDQNIFYTEDQDGFIVSEIGRGNQAIRRQRLGAGEQMTVTTRPYAIRVWEHLSRIMAGRIDFNTMVQRVATSIQKKKYEQIFETFQTITSATPGMYNELTYSGSYDEDSVLNVIEHVEADNNAPATIIGTRKALRKLQMDVLADGAKDDMYAMGYYGRFNGTPTYRIQSRYKEGTHDFIFPDDKIYVVAGNEKFIKFVTEGNAILDTRQAVENMDLTQEYWYITQYGIALMMGHGIGICTFTE